ncbi:Exosome complex component RRP4 [Geodia barretti]|uniref:Exosome complex component RRP4 n=1 Tax=Geodia barretti TaxID=519541 RepID=A0AA35S5Y7_GEOBA|nr:Exosome complex component RRP4 [Geodia barretti]
METLHLVAPGDVITTDTGFMRGHGTYHSDDGKLVASVAGVVQRINRLISVRPLQSRYAGEVGDVVVGRIVEVQQKRWKVDTFSRLESVLLLSSINLPGGVLRRRSAQDELMMRTYFTEGDLISAEVQQVFSDGSLSLHTRSLKYGKLKKGCLITVPPSLVKRCKNHFHNMLCGASVIIGNNGYVWISSMEVDQEDQILLNPRDEPDTTREKDIAITREERETIARLRNCIQALVARKLTLFDTSIQYTFDASRGYEVKELLREDVMQEITEPARNID